jgi:glycerol-3-phosphate dehydrogenase (NAD(P)+)
MSELERYRAFWSKATVVVAGGGSWGTVLAHLAARHVAEVRISVRQEEQARAINDQHVNPQYLPNLQLNERVKAYPTLDEVFQGKVHGVIWALPSDVSRTEAKRLAARLEGDEYLFHATKGIEPVTNCRISEVLSAELPCPRIGVISGPNLALEISEGQPAATVVASRLEDVIRAGRALLEGPGFQVLGSHDLVGIEWAGAMKNIYAIAAGAVEARGWGWNTKAMLFTFALDEMVRFTVPLGAQASTLEGVAGMGDLVATCSSPQSRNFRVGYRLAQGEALNAVLSEIGQTAEGVRTARTVVAFARQRKIALPLAEAVLALLQGEVPVDTFLNRVGGRASDSLVK